MGIQDRFSDLELVDIDASADELNLLDGAGAAVASGTQASKISDPTDLATCITAITAIIDALEAFGISASS